MDRKIFDKIEADQMKKRPEVKVGDTVKLSMKIKEGNKERTQIFEGVVIAKSGT
ncbi:MAG TPA: 50S ribosomal protein L19, partial [Candidatus Dojkabacteria bacterium]|nr:50S ribosomal protein L19 [Candidatus Dojkabacteria bacterium]